MTLSEKAVSKKQQRFFGMVRAAQKGEMEDPSPEITQVASTVSKSDVKKMASTKHKGLPEKVPANEGVINAYKKGIKRHKDSVEKKKIKNRKAVPYAALAAEYSPELPEIEEAKVDKGRSDYGKATIRNWRHSGPSTVEPAMFDPDNKRGKTIDKRREEHKTRRGVKGAKVPTYKKEEVELDERLGGKGYKSYTSLTGKKVSGDWEDSDRGAGNKAKKRSGGKVEKKSPTYLAHVHNKEEFELEEERSARKMNVRTKKTIQTTIAKNAAAEAKRKEKKTGEYKETPKKKPKLGLGYKTVVKHAQAKKAAAKKTPITRATVKKAEKKTAPSTKSDARTKAQYKGTGAPGLDAHKERIAKHEAKRGVKKPKAAKKTPVTKATTTKPAPKKAPARKSVKSTPITKAASTPKKTKTFGDFVKDGVKRHRKATQGARVFGKGFAKGVKKSVKFAKDVKKVVTNEQVNRVSKMVKALRRKKEVLKQPEKATDAGARAKRLLQRKVHAKYVSGSEDLVPDDIRDHKTWDNFKQMI